MSFLKNIVKNAVSDGIGKGVRDAVSGAVEKAVNPVAEKWANQTAQDLDKAAGNVSAEAKETNNAFSNLRRAAENYANAMDQAAKEAGFENTSNNSGNSEIYADDGIPAADKIRKVLKESFPQYEIKENVSPATLGGIGKFMNYSFGIYSGGIPKLFIMLVGKTTCSTRLYRWSKEEAAKKCITMINFVEHYPNNVNYIRDRLSKYL